MIANSDPLTAVAQHAGAHWRASSARDDSRRARVAIAWSLRAVGEATAGSAAVRAALFAIVTHQRVEGSPTVPETLGG